MFLVLIRAATVCKRGIYQDSIYFLMTFVLKINVIIKIWFPVALK